MYYAYVLKSKVNGDIYIGYTDNLQRRFAEHNNGNTKYTKQYRPWILIYYEAYRIKGDATKREKELKLHAAKELLKIRLKKSLEF